MTRGRPTPREHEHEERVAALLSLDLDLVRLWARRWGVPLLPADDAALLVSIHEARVRDPLMPPDAVRASLAWLAERGDAVAQAALG